MKRTKQVFHRDGDDVPQYVSGLRQFDGEDPRKSAYLTLATISNVMGI